VYVEDCVGERSSIVSSNGFVLDTTRPTGGWVRVVDVTNASIEYQQSTEAVRVQFGGFADKESGMQRHGITIMEYGSNRSLWARNLTASKTLTALEIQVQLEHRGRYLVVVEARNAAGLKSNATKLIAVDRSPPFAGIVRHGSGTTDAKCQSSASSIQASWHGFHDDVSGLFKYQWAIGSSLHIEAIHQFTDVPGGPNAKVADLTTLSLSEGDLVYVTVRAFNKAGLWVDARSKGILITGDNCVFNFMCL
jgi:hypothetical protein